MVIGVAALAALVVVVAGPALAGGTVSESFDATYALGPGGLVSLENVNGDVHVEAWGRDEVWVRATKRASSAELLEELEIEVDASDDRVAIDTRYPRRMTGGRVEVEYTISVPRTARLAGIELVNGSLDVVGVEGGAEIEIVNGAVLARGLRGQVDVDTVNGTMEVAFEVLDGTDRVELESVNGRIELYLGAGASAAIQAETVNGRIANDLGLDVKKGKYVGSSLRGEVSGGACPVDLSTVNGGIEIKAR
jgi:hypothetical protein